MKLLFTITASNLLVSGLASSFASQNPVKGTRPNILFCIADDASFQYFGAYGCKWTSTPGFDRVARNGILFTNAYTPNAKSAPSRACIITGRNSWQLEEAANHIGNFPQKFITFTEELKTNGYFTGYTGKGWAPGNPGQVNGKPRELTGKPYQSKRLIPPTSSISNYDYAANFQDFMNEKPASSPWCFWYGGLEPHRNYEYGSGVNKGEKALNQISRVPSFWPDNDTVRNDMLDYALEVEHFDSHLQKMLLLLEEKGELENTIIVVTSDNGMPFPRAKGLGYEYSNHMPLAIMWLSGIKEQGSVVADYISFIDFAPTFLEVAGIRNSRLETTGRSLTDVFNNSHNASDREFILLGQERHDYGRPLNKGYPIRSIIKNGFLYMYNFAPDLWPAGNPETGYLNTDGSPTKTNILNLRRTGTDRSYWEKCFGMHPQEELYHIAIDPDCSINLANTGIYQTMKSQMKELLFKELKKQNDPRMFGKGEVFNRYPFAQESSENFYERFLKGEIKSYQTEWVNPGDFE